MDRCTSCGEEIATSARCVNPNCPASYTTMQGTKIAQPRIGCITFASNREGWQCPNCGRVMAPWMPSCENCQGKPQPVFNTDPAGTTGSTTQPRKEP